MKKYSIKRYENYHDSFIVKEARVTAWSISKKSILAITLIFILFGCSKNNDPKPHDWIQIFEDDFNTTTLDLSKWTYWTTGAYNQEKQLYQFENLIVKDGSLEIKAVYENPAVSGDTLPGVSIAKNFDYTSGRIESKQSFSGANVGTSYSKIKVIARIKLPKEYGLWPAFWLLGVDDPGESWPQNGEIDIMEAKKAIDDFNPITEYQTNHFYGTDPGKNLVSGGEFPFQTNADLSNYYHEYSVEWSQNELAFYFDGKLVNTHTYGYVPNLWNKDQRIVFNLAYGGDFFGKNFQPIKRGFEFGTMYIDRVTVLVK